MLVTISIQLKQQIHVTVKEETIETADHSFAVAIWATEQKLSERGADEKESMLWGYRSCEKWEGGKDLELREKNQKWKVEIGADRAGVGPSHTFPDMVMRFIT